MSKSAVQQVGLAMQRVVWSRRASSWDEMSNPGLERVISELVEYVGDRPEAIAIDLGCGSGQLSIPLAAHVKEVVAVDIAPRMVELLDDKLKRMGISNVRPSVGSVQELGLGDGAVQLVVSNYVLHHLSDREKAEFVKDAFRWLSPGGELVFGDMMFGRGGSAEDRKVIADKVKVLLGKGVGGWWRIAKNGVRYLFRIQEKPISLAAWVGLLKEAGFEEITSKRIVAEAAIVCARKPA